MASQEDLVTQRNKIQRQILELESTLGADSSIVDLLSSSDSDEESDDSGHAGDEVVPEDLEAERQQIQREIEVLEQTLGVDAALADAITDSEHGTGSHIDSSDDSDDELELPQDLETCLQMNLVYQEVLKEKLADLERLLKENRQQQKEIEAQLSGPVSTFPGLPHMKLFLGTFMKPYFKDKLTGLGPPANEETKEKLSHGTRPCDEMKIRRWEGWQKTLLINSVVTDTMKRMLQPKMSKMEYLTAKMSKAKDVIKEELQKQIALLEKGIAEISSMSEDQLYGNRSDDHDWDKIANTDFEGLRSSEDLMRFWQNYLHPLINKSSWKQDEIEKLAAVAEEYRYCHWDKIAEALGTNRTAFMCFQTYQRYIAKSFRKREWNKEEDQILRDLVEKMRIGNFIPYTQMSYFMEGRDHAQLMYRWTSVLDPSIKKGPWSKEEDQLLRKAVEKYGLKDWWKIRLEVPGRTDNACRDRYLDCLRDDVKKGAWSDEEVELLKKLVQKYGVGKWAKIASEIPNRIDSQCLHKWKWVIRTAAKKGVKRERKQSTKPGPSSKRRKIAKRIKKEEESESSSEDENTKVEYMDSDEEQVKGNKSDLPLEDDLEQREEYIQPHMKEWMPVGGKAQVHPAETVKTMLVRLPTEEESQAYGNNCTDDQGFQYRSPSAQGKRPTRCTMLNHMGYPVKTYVGTELVTLDNKDLWQKDAMIKVPLTDVKNLLICMGASAMKGRAKTKPTKSLVRDQRIVQTGEQETCRMRSGQTVKRKHATHVCKAVVNTSLDYGLMKAVIPWIGNVLMPLPLSEKKVYEADVVRLRAADIPLPRTVVFTFFLKVLQIDAEGCKNVIEAEKNKVPLTPLIKPRRQPAKWYTSAKKVSVLLREKKERAENYLKSTQLTNNEHFASPTPHTTKLPIPSIPHSKSKPQIRPALMVPQTFITQPNMRQGVSPLQPGQTIQLSAQGTAQSLSQPVLQLVVPVEPGKSVQPTDPPTTSVSIPSITTPPTESGEETRTPKRQRKPTVKAQAILEKAKSKASRKQSTNNKCGGNAPAVTLLPHTTAWILTPAGLMPVTGINLPSGILGNQNQEIPSRVPQMVIHPPLTVDHNSLLHAVGQTNPTNVTPTDVTSSIAETNLDQNPDVSTLPSDNNALTVSSAVTSTASVPLASLNNTNSVSVSAVNTVTHTITSNSSLTPAATETNLTSTPVATSQNFTPSSGSNADKVSSAPSVDKNISIFSASRVKSAPVIHPVYPCALNISVPAVQRPSSHPVSQVLFQNPIIVNQNGSLALISAAGQCLPTSVSSVPFANSPEVSNSPAKSSPSSVVPAVNPAPMFRILTPSSQILPMVQQTTSHVKKQHLQTSNSSPNPLSFDSNLMFLEHPAQVKQWMAGNGGITLPTLNNKMPYLPPFVSSINTLASLLRAKESLLQGAVRLLPEKEGSSNEEETKVAAVRKLVSERFKTNPAYSLLKARFLSCFTLPALLATIHPCKDSELHSSHKLGGDEDEEDDKDEVELINCGDDQIQLTKTLCNTNESEASAVHFSGMSGRRQRSSQQSE